MVDFGTDLSGIYDCPANMPEVSGRLLLAQAVARRLITPRGRLIGSPNYGYDLTQFINDDLSLQGISRIQSATQDEIVKDERVLSASVSISLDMNGSMLVKVLLGDASGPFSLVLSVTQVSVSVLEISQ